jgi:hypothetical protein
VQAVHCDAWKMGLLDRFLYGGNKDPGQSYTGADRTLGQRITAVVQYLHSRGRCGTTTIDLYRIRQNLDIIRQDLPCVMNVVAEEIEVITASASNSTTNSQHKVSVHVVLIISTIYLLANITQIACSTFAMLDHCFLARSPRRAHTQHHSMVAVA